jgi:hypothetical protein
VSAHSRTSIAARQHALSVRLARTARLCLIVATSLAPPAVLAASASAAMNVRAPSLLSASMGAMNVTLDQPPPRSNDASPSFRGSASGTLTVTVSVYAGSSASGEPIATLKAQPSAGSFATASVTPPLADGPYTAVATQPAPVGFEEGTSSPVRFEVDTQPPLVTLKEPRSPSNDTTPSFSGTASEASDVTVEVFEGTRPEGRIVASVVVHEPRGSWTSPPLAPSLPSGRHNFTAVAIQPSEIKNRPGRSSAVGFVVDTEPPTVTLNALPSPSRDTTPVFSGTASDPTPVTVEVFEGETVEGKRVASVTAPVSGGNWTSPPLTPSLPSGLHTYTALASQESAIGNGPGASIPVMFVLDTTSPKVTLNPLPSPSGNRSPSFSGTASDLTPVLVNIYRGAAAEGTLVASVEAEVDHGRWASARASLSPLQWGEYTAVATQASSIRNPGGVSLPITFAVEPIAPSVATGATSSVTRSSAALYGSVNPNGAPVSACYFEYGSGSSYGKSIECGFVSEASGFPEAGTSPVPVFARIYGLSPATTYHVRLVAAGEGGTAAGVDSTFTTLAPWLFNEASSGSKPPSASAAASGVAAFKAEALTPRGRGASITALLRSGVFALRLKVPVAGRAVIGWYYPPLGAKAARKSARVLVAWGARTFSAAGSGDVKIRLTGPGRRLLAAAGRIRLTATCVFTPAGAARVRTSATFELRR